MDEGLGSAPLPPISADEHVLDRSGPDAILYLDLACPHCAASWVAVRELPLRLCVRHFPIASKRPRATALHAAVEAAAELGGDGAFWAFWNSLMEDQGHQDDPHLWSRAEKLGLELDRFEVARRGQEAAARVQRDFRGGIRAGVIGTPAGFVAGQPIEGDLSEALRALAVN